VTDTTAIRRVVNKAFDDLEHIDIIVNNAGYAVFGAAEELTDDQIHHQINTNIIGSIQVARAAMPHLRRQGGGRILQLSSMGGQIALPALSIYHATKWAVEGFFESMMQEIASFNITITLIEPAGSKTHFGYSSMVYSPPMEEYENTPVGIWRKARQSGEYHPTLDPEKAVEAMIDSVEMNPAPKRLLVGGQAYNQVHQALTERLSDLEAQKSIAFAADYDKVK